MKKTGEVYKWKGRVLNLSALSRALNERGYGRGATVSNLSKIFSGEYDPRFEMVKMLASILEVSLSEFDELLQSCRRANAAWERMMDEADKAVEPDGSGKFFDAEPAMARKALVRVRGS